MTQKAPGKYFRKGISLIEIMRMFPDDDAAEQWYIEGRWPNGPYCPYCGLIQRPVQHQAQDDDPSLPRLSE